MPYTILESIHGSRLANNNAKELLGLVINKNTTTNIRIAAFRALQECDVPTDWRDIVETLSSFDDIESLRVALHIMPQYVELFSGKCISDILIKFVITNNNGMQTPYLCTAYKLHEKISALEELLPSSQFMRVHKSFIIAIDKIKMVEGNRITIGEHLIPIGKYYKRMVMKLLRSG